VISRRLPEFRSRAWWFVVVGGLLGIVLLISIVSLGLGQVGVPVGDVWGALTGTGDDRLASRIVMDLRLPRLLLALLIGAQLAVSGAILQGVTRNALASPDLIGVTAGAGFMAVIFVLVIPEAPRILLPLAALAGGTISGAIVYLIAWKQGVSPERLALTGIAVTAIFQAAVTAIVTLSLESTNVNLALQWLTGSLYGRGWGDLLLLLPWSVIGIASALVVSHKVNLLLLGDNVAAGLGMRIERARIVLVAIAVALAASAVSISGTVAFIGLVIPHFVRLLIGADHRLVLPLSAIAGAVLLLVADDIARTVVPSLEIPAGLLTALIGAPYFIYLIMRSKTRISV
jgi:ABC-type Fe3+-siderophore transport system permease subunit